MARILIGWELGANRGHLVRMLRHRDALVAAGHQVALAVQRIDGIGAETGHAEPVWQAPVWPRLLAWAAGTSARPAATLGDILARLGLAEPGVLSALIRGWEGILIAERPDVVIAEYAPALLRAATGRMPTIANGIGFDLPPATMASFPSLSGQPAVHDEAATLTIANAELAAVGRPALATLPALFAADAALVNVIDEIDPYRGIRPGDVSAPLVARPMPPLALPEGDEIFVYWPERGPTSDRVWEALRLSGLPVRVHLARIRPAQAARLAGMGFIVETLPLPFAEIVRRSRLLLSHGGGGFVINGMLCGRPQVVVHFDLEKRNNGLALDREGLGAQMPLGEFDAAAFARGLVTLHADAALLARTMTRAAEFRARITRSAEEQMVATVEWLG